MLPEDRPRAVNGRYRRWVGEVRPRNPMPMGPRQRRAPTRRLGRRRSWMVPVEAGRGEGHGTRRRQTRSRQNQRKNGEWPWVAATTLSDFRAHGTGISMFLHAPPCAGCALFFGTTRRRFTSIRRSGDFMKMRYGARRLVKLGKDRVAASAYRARVEQRRLGTSNFTNRIFPAHRPESMRNSW